MSKMVGTSVSEINSGKRMTYSDWCFFNDEGLTVQEIKFADAYTENPDMQAAAIEAGIEEQKAKGWAKALLRKPQVKRRIENNLAIARRSSVMSVRERLDLLTNIGRSSIVDCISVVNGRLEIDLEKAKAIGSDRGICSIKIDDKSDTLGGSSRSRSVQMTSPIQAVQELNRMQKVYDQKLQNTGAIVLIPREDLEL